MPSPLGSAEVPCARCGTRVRGIAWGEYCPDCAALRVRRAKRLARRISALVGLLLAGWIFWRVPNQFVPRFFGAVSVVLAYFVSHRLVYRTAMEFMKKD
jgi:hypothetical protein